MCIPTRTHLTYINDKPWFTVKLRLLRQAKEDAYRKGDNVLYKQAKYTLEMEIRVAKRNCYDKLRIQFSSSDSASVWKGLKEITSYKIPSPQHSGESTTGRRSEWVLLQVWKKNTPDSPWTPLLTTINTSSNPPLPHTSNSDQRRQGVPGLPEAEKEKK